MQELENYDEVKDYIEEKKYISNRSLKIKSEYIDRMLKARVQYEIHKKNEG